MRIYKIFKHLRLIYLVYPNTLAVSLSYTLIDANGVTLVCMYTLTGAGRSNRCLITIIYKQRCIRIYKYTQAGLCSQ